MSTYAIIKTGGKQVKVEVGQAIYVEKINAEAGSEVTFNEVVLVGGDTRNSTLIDTLREEFVNGKIKERILKNPFFFI